MYYISHSLQDHLFVVVNVPCEVCLLSIICIIVQTLHILLFYFSLVLCYTNLL